MKIKEKKLTLAQVVKRGHYLYFLYYKLYTLIMDRIIAGQSLDTFVCNDGEEIFPVQSANYRILDCLFPYLAIKTEDVFVDVGCGWGRLLGYLRQRGVRPRKMIGVEINREAANFAASVFRDERDVLILYADAASTPIPDGTVFLLFNPFGKTVFCNFIDTVERNCQSGVVLYYLHAIYADEMKRRSNKWMLKEDWVVTPKYHIPIRLCKYQYLGLC